MLTLQKTEHGKPVCEVVKGSTKIRDVYWLPIVQKEHQNEFEDYQQLNTEAFRDLFELNRDDATAILSAIENGETKTQNIL